MHDSEKLGAFFDISLEPLIIDNLSKADFNSFLIQFSSEKESDRCLKTYLKALNENLVSQHIHKNYTYNEAENFIGYHPSQNFDFVDLIDEIGKKYITFSPIPQVDQCKIVEWRNIVQQCGEDMFVCERIAKSNSMIRSDTFSWNPIIISNDRRLNLILKEGVSENHCHLMASAPIADLNWCALHNEKKFWKYLKKEDYEKTHKCVDSYDLFIKRMIKASVIRRYFFTKFYFKDSAAKTTEVLKKIIDFLRIDNLNLLKTYYLNNGNYPNNENYLNNVKLPSFQPFSKQLKVYNDYTMALLQSRNPWEGERVLLYYLFKNFSSLSGNEKKLFYLYLIYRMFFYSQFVMKKFIPGFRGFLNVERYKEAFLDQNDKYKDLLIRSGIKVTQSSYLKNFEIRIAPKETKKENIKYVKRIMLNSLIAKSEMENDYQWRDYSYYGRKKDKCDFYTLFPHLYIVFHFIKMGDEPLQIQHGIVKKRNSIVREKIKQQTRAISEFINSQSKYARLVLGIDAANSEIGCRPEVFGQTFRYLRSLSHYDYYSAKMVHSLRGVTYHVAEDFIDIADGLRAIFECAIFLNLQPGDRLGHAIALGIDALEYYRLKNMSIYKKKQDALDDYVWMYFILNKIGGHDDFKAEIYYAIHQMMREIYDDDFTLSDYYDSMKLRGDNPEIYFHYFSTESNKTMDIETYYKQNYFFTGYHSFALNTHESAIRSRKNKKAVLLYYQYHYRHESRKEAEKKVLIDVKEPYIRAIQSLQKYVKKLIIMNRLVVEVNLTSNFVIGSYQGYQYSTLFSFNRHLLDPNYKDNLQVCINTDDSGVFASNLYTEYSLLFQLLTQPENPLDSSIKYDAETAYQYIDYLRNLSNMFTFNEPDITQEQNIFESHKKRVK